jgi:sulfur carrier protein
MAEAPEQRAVRVTVVVCVAPRQVGEWELDLPAGSTVLDALQACGAEVPGGLVPGATQCALGIWGRATSADTVLEDSDRVEVYRPLKVDPKVARRERFARQGARTTGLFKRQRPGGKAGY